MAWKIKKEKKQKQEDEYDDEDEDDEEEDEDSRKMPSAIKKAVSEPIMAKKDYSYDEVISFAMPAREGLMWKNSKESYAEDLWSVLADIKNQLNRIERSVAD